MTEPASQDLPAHAVVTGAAQGIGAAIAVGLAGAGCAVTVLDVKDTAETVAAAGGRATGMRVDVRDRDAVRAAVDTAVDRAGGLDVLVTCAGIYGAVTTIYGPRTSTRRCRSTSRAPSGRFGRRCRTCADAVGASCAWDRLPGATVGCCPGRTMERARAGCTRSSAGRPGPRRATGSSPTRSRRARSTPRCCRAAATPQTRTAQAVRTRRGDRLGGGVPGLAGASYLTGSVVDANDGGCHRRTADGGRLPATRNSPGRRTGRGCPGRDQTRS